MLPDFTAGTSTNINGRYSVGKNDVIPGERDVTLTFKPAPQLLYPENDGHDSAGVLRWDHGNTNGVNLLEINSEYKWYGMWHYRIWTMNDSVSFSDLKKSGIVLEKHQTYYWRVSRYFSILYMSDLLTIGELSYQKRKTYSTTGTFSFNIGD